MTVLTRALSWMPTTSSTVSSATMSAAGRLKTIGTPNEVRSRGAAGPGSALRVVHRGRPARPAGAGRAREERLEVVRPADRDRDVADRVLEDEVPADDPGHELAERRRRRTCTRCRRPGPSPRSRRSRAPRSRTPPPSARRRPSAPGRRRCGRLRPPAAVPIGAKMPAPITAPMPSAVRLKTPSDRFSRCSVRSASCWQASTSFRRNRELGMWSRRVLARAADGTTAAVIGVDVTLLAR